MIEDAKEQASADVAMQWEIFDAGESRWPGDVIVVPPFEAKPVRNPDWFRQELECAKGSDIPARKVVAEGILQWLSDALSEVDGLLGSAERARESGDDRSAEERLAKAGGLIGDKIRALYDERSWFEGFVGLIDFDDLRRPEKGLLGLEKRCMPTAKQALGKYQTWRVNQLILETILPPDIYPRATYLNTTQVAEFVKKTLYEKYQKTSLRERTIVDVNGGPETQQVLELGTITVYAHQDHLSWCHRQVEQVFARREVRNGDPGVWWVEFQRLDSVKDPDWKYDNQSAQVWTRSRENYAVYKRMP